MACSRFEYVKQFESHSTLLPNTWIVARIDGHGFHRFSATHKWKKPNDIRALQLMNACAARVMHEFRDIVIAIGESDEYSFVFHPSTKLYNRRAEKLNSLIASLFSSSYVYYWPHFFDPNETPLQYIPSFDCRMVCYPSDQNIRDYLSWRQADTHINNLYNTCFWHLVQEGGMSNTEAELFLKDTISSDKNELLFSRFGINYSQLPAMYRKASILIWDNLTSEMSNKDKNTVDTKDNDSNVIATATFDSGVDTQCELRDKEQKRWQEFKLPSPSFFAQDAGNQKDANSDEKGASTNIDNTSNPSSSPASSSSSSSLLEQHKQGSPRVRRVLRLVHQDLIQDRFWNDHPHIIPYISQTELKRRAKKVRRKLGKQKKKTQAKE